MSKLDVDMSNLYNLEQQFSDLIRTYENVLSISKNTYIPYRFQKKYAFNENYSNIAKDKQKLLEIQTWVSDSLKDLRVINEALQKQANNLPENSIKDKDFFI